jgi:hypothetical protein
MLIRSSGDSVDSQVFWPAALVLLILAVYMPVLRNEATVFDGPIPPVLGARGAHGMNLLVHILVTILVYHLGRILLSRETAAFLAAILFAVHPLHVDAVARAAALPGMLATLLILGGAWLLMKLSEKSPVDISLAAAVGAFVMWQWVQRSAPGDAVSYVENPLVASPLPERLMTAVALLSRSLILAAWPFRLSPDYSFYTFPVVSDPASVGFLVATAVVVTAGVLAAWWTPRQPAYLLCYGFFTIGALAAINPLFPQRPILAEHFLYFPSIAFCWAAAQLLQDTGTVPRVNRHDLRSAKPLAAIVLCLLLPWGAKTFIRTGQWRTERVLLEAAERTHPENARVQVLLGDFHFRGKDYLAADRRYRRALEIYPKYEEAAAGLAASRRARGR